MPEFQTSPGMRDVLPPETSRWRRLNTVFAEVVEVAGYGQIVTPLLEDLGVFTRIGDATDVVTKEMYDFSDKGGRHVSLRPEMTASVCRSFAQHRPAQLPWKVWYTGSNFRYEKPQRGRYRQFDQVGVEVLGVDDPHLDVEVIALAWEFYRRLGLQQVNLVLNSLGEPEDRAAYVDALRAHFESAELSEQGRATLARNPLRVLDSKREADAAAIAARRRSPTSTPTRRRRTSRPSGRASTCWGSPTSSSRNWSAGSTTTDAPSSNSRAAPWTPPRTPSAAAAGTTASWRRSAGLPRRASDSPSASTAHCSRVTTKACSPTTPPPLDAFVVDVVGGEAAVAITSELRAAGLRCDRAFDGRSMKAQMKLANRSGARFAVIVGEDECTAGTAIIRPMARDAGDQIVVARDELVGRLDETTHPTNEVTFR